MASIPSYQYQGPHVLPTASPVGSLDDVINAMTQGGAAGRAQPTLAGSIANGIQGGIQNFNAEVATKQDQAIKDQNIALNQLKIDEELDPDHIALKEAQAKYEVARTERVTQQNDQLSLQDKVAQLAADPNPLIHNQVLQNPEYLKAVIQDPKFADTVFGTLISHGDLDDSGKDQINKYYNAAQDIARARDTKSYDDKFRTGLIQQSAKDINEFYQTPDFKYAIQGMNNPGEIVSRVQIFPKGIKSTTTDGRLLTDSSSDKNTQDTDDVGKYDLFVDGKKQATPISEKAASTFLGFQRAYNGGLYDIQNKYAPIDLFGGRSNTPYPPPNPQAAPAKDLQFEPSEDDVIYNIEKDRLYPPGSQTPQSQETSSTNPNAPQASNSNIVDQRRAQFDALAKKRPPGIAPGAIENRLAQRNQELQQKFAPPKPLASPTPAQVLPPSPPPAVPPTPTAALSKMTNTPVSLRKDISFNLKPTTWDYINSEPLLAGKPALVKGLAAVESGGKRNAQSPTGVRGLLQVTKATAAEFGLDRDIPEQNVLAGQKYLYKSIGVFNGDLRLGLAGYNGGIGLIQHAVREVGDTNWDNIKGYLKTVLSPQKYKEVAEYPDKVLSATSHFMVPQSQDDQTTFTMYDDQDLLRKDNGTVEA